MHTLQELVQSLRDAGQRLVLANPSRAVQAQLKRVHILEDIGQQWVYVRTADAVAMCSQHLHERLALQGAETAGEVAVEDISLSLPPSPQGKGDGGKASGSEDAAGAIAAGTSGSDGASGSRRADDSDREHGGCDIETGGESSAANALMPQSQQSNAVFHTPRGET